MNTGQGPLTPQQQSRASRLFDDLLNLEINVIVKEGMTARKMPDPLQAFLEIAETYENLLGGFADTVALTWQERMPIPAIRVLSPEDASALGAERPPRVDESGMLTSLFSGPVVTGQVVSATTFKHLRWWAIEMAAVARVVMADDDWSHPEKLDGKCVLFKRINRNSEKLEETLRNLERDNVVGPAMQLSTDQLVNLRKIWEVGTETVVMQTVIQLDGDIITRIQPGPATSSKAIQDLHRQSVDSAVKNWQFLGQTLAHILGSVLKKFL